MNSPVEFRHKHDEHGKPLRKSWAEMSLVNRWKQWIARRLQNANGFHQLCDRLDRVEKAIESHPDQQYRDVLGLLLPMANIGGLTVVMSRLVGPRGVVCAFEASPRSLADCQQNVVANGCSNVQVFQAAVFRESGKEISFYFGHHTGSDSVYPTEGQQRPALRVTTLALDDFIETTGLIPKLIKMDIEGAEYDALFGVRRTIAAHRPLFVIETQPDQPAALDYLRQHSYSIIDLASYRLIHAPSDFAPGCVVANVLCTPPSIDVALYFPAVPWDFVQTIRSDELRTTADHSAESTAAIDLPPGRYRVDVTMTGSDTNTEMFCGIEVNGTVRFRYRGSTKRIASSYLSWVLELTQQGKDVKFFFQFLNGTTDPTFVVEQISIHCARGGPFATVPFS